MLLLLSIDKKTLAISINCRDYYNSHLILSEAAPACRRYHPAPAGLYVAEVAGQHQVRLLP